MAPTTSASGRIAAELEQAERDERAGLIPSAHEGGDPTGLDDHTGAVAFPEELAGSDRRFVMDELRPPEPPIGTTSADYFDAKQEDARRLAYIDQAAIARFGAGYPVGGCYREAAKLWDERAKWLREQERKR